MGGISCWSRAKVLRSPPLEEEGKAETVCDELTIPPISLRHWWGGGREEAGLKLNLERRKQRGGSVF